MLPPTGMASRAFSTRLRTADSNCPGRRGNSTVRFGLQTAPCALSPAAWLSNSCVAEIT